LETFQNKKLIPIGLYRFVKSLQPIKNIEDSTLLKLCCRVSFSLIENIFCTQIHNTRAIMVLKATCLANYFPLLKD